MPDDFATNLRRLIRARFPLLSIQTAEESRVLAEIAAVVGNRTQIAPARQVYTWSTANGFAALGQPGNAETRTPHAALTAAAALTMPSVVILLDLHPWMGSSSTPADTQLVRQIKDTVRFYKDGPVPRTLIMISPTPRIPPDLESLVTLLEFPLPTEAQIRSTLDGMISRNTAAGALTLALGPDGAERLAKAALGLTAFEAENAFARAMVDDGRLTDDDIVLVQEEKRQIVAKSGVLEVVRSSIGLDDIGGLENLKTWLRKRNGAWLDEAAAYGLPAPKGVLVTGVPGCGKSMTAKAMASAWSLPLVRLDIGRVFGGLVGASEQNMRTALRTAEAIAPCVLWIDEIEKGLAAGNGESDGLSRRVLGYLLTWMAERKSRVFLVATANQVHDLPAELLRKGRFDEIFFIDLPDAATRVEIFALHLDRRSLAKDDIDLSALAAAADGFSGAEIEQVIVSALYAAHAEQAGLDTQTLMQAIRDTRPLSLLMAEQVQALREWALPRTVPAD